ncbi:MAG: carboxy terminal-processing peptidase, partial [Saprospiraceae bacterium]
STFGKGTVQRFFNLDKAITGYDDMKPLGDIKLTLQKFYRVNGGSTQLKGVVPDINLPDNQQFIAGGEKELDYPLEWTEIDAVPFSQDIVRLNTLGNLKEKSQTRIKASPQFEKVISNALRIKGIREETLVPLQLDEYRALDRDREQESQEFEDIFVPIENLKPQNLALDLPTIQSDSSRIGRNQAWMESLGKDIYIEETLHIMKDLMTINHKS